ncbi:MAG: extracellular solute-binding protein [Lachnospiraceae bacterium]|nr:extracellular solute-binding protein [Lachnospiraceae bacterium]
MTVCCLTQADILNRDGSEDARYASKREWYAAENTPFSPYPKTITYTLGKLSGAENSYMPDGDTYENNAYTRYLKKKLNVQNKDAFELSDNSYNERVSISIASGHLPDIFLVDSEEEVRKLAASGQIADLTDVYDNCASVHIQNIYSSYGSTILDRARIKGRLYALPETNIDNGPSLLWLRYDWLKKLNLPTPKTVDDVRTIIQAFMKNDPGGIGAGKTTGLLTLPELYGDSGYSQEYQTDIIFAKYNAYPGHWIQKNGKLVYGSVQPEVKKALAYLRDMYKDGTLDRNFLFRESENLIDLIVNGQCGAFFGPWWSPNNPLMEAVKKNPDADWRPYLIETGSDGSTSFASQNPNGKFVVVRKGFKHPEIVMKIVSVLFDYMPYGDDSTQELENYYISNVDPTARPLSINVDFKNALSSCYEHLNAVLTMGEDESGLDLLEGAYYKACRSYLDEVDSGGKISTENWAAYTSRIVASHKISDKRIKEVPSVYFSDTDTMKTSWWKLTDLEKKTFISIVTGDEPLSAFDDFVKTWYQDGGGKITLEVRQTNE